MTLVYRISLPSTYHSAQMLFFVECQAEPVSGRDEAAIRAREILQLSGDLAVDLLYLITSHPLH